MRIDFERLVVDVPGQRALDDVSGGIAAGSVTALIGPSGAGKSTLLGVLAGLVRPDAGRVRFDGADVTARRPEERRLGVVFQDLRLFQFLTGRQNVAFGPRAAGLDAAARRRRVDEALRWTRAADFADKPAAVLSGGERQRIAIARALATEPRALLLDEPFAALDAELRRQVRDELGGVVRALGLTAVVVTHDREDAFALASRLVVMRGGRIEQAGDAATLYHQPATRYVATLLGEANLVAVAERQAGRARVGATWMDVSGDGAQLVLRPEALRVVRPEAPRVAAAGEGWPARLREARFAGARWRLVLDAGALGTLVALAPAPPDGESVVVVPPARAHTVD